MFNKCCQQEGKSIDAFVTDLHMLAKTCDFKRLEDEFIHNRIVVGCRDIKLWDTYNDTGSHFGRRSQKGAPEWNYEGPTKDIMAVLKKKNKVKKTRWGCSYGRQWLPLEKKKTYKKKKTP